MIDVDRDRPGVASFLKNTKERSMAMIFGHRETLFPGLIKILTFLLSLNATFWLKPAYSFYRGKRETGKTFVVIVERNDGRRFTGTMVKPRVLATVAHGLSNFHDGGVVVKTPGGQEIESEKVVVHSRIKTRSHIPDEYDLAFVLLKRALSDYATLAVDRPRSNEVILVSYSYTAFSRSTGYKESGKNFWDRKIKDDNIFLTTAYLSGPSSLVDIPFNSSPNQRGESGTALLEKDGKTLLGIFTGCQPEQRDHRGNRYIECGYVNLQGPIAKQVTETAKKELAAYWTKNEPSSEFSQRSSRLSPQSTRNLTSRRRPSLREYQCHATCKIEYQNPYDKIYENVQVSVEAGSRSEADSKARSALEKSCDAFCRESRDAFRCALTGSVSC